MSKPLLLSLSLLLSTGLAHADEAGKPVVTPVACNDAFSSVDALCKLFQQFGSAVGCKVTANNCVKGTQELYLGAHLGGGNASTMWNGLGGYAIPHTAANLCLLRDMKDAPIVSKAVASTALGNVAMEQTVQFASFDPKTLSWSGYHRGRACVPAIGCLDVFTQKITARAVKSNAPGAKAGAFEIVSVHGLDVSADGLSQGFAVEIPTLSVVTPYGVVSAKPGFGIARAMGFSLAPYANGNYRSLVTGPWGKAKVAEVYGRTPGLKVSQLNPTYLATGGSWIDNRTIGFQSQVGFGSRDVNPKHAVWAPAAGDYPARPDEVSGPARSGAEKTPNASMGAEVNIKYSPVELLPEVIRDNPFVKINFSIFAKPLVQTGFSSQFNILNYEIAKGDKLVAPAGPIDYRVTSMDQYKGIKIAAASSSVARVALEAGVDLDLRLVVPLPWPLDDIDVTLINVHPRTTLLESVVDGQGQGNRSASATSQASLAGHNMNGEWFQSYQRLNGGAAASGRKQVEQCLASPAASAPAPAAPSYQPGKPEDLLKIVKYPCNICVGTEGFSYQDENNVTHKIPRFLSWLFQASQQNRPAGARWSCTRVSQSGCHDMCHYDTNTNKLTVEQTAVEMIAAGTARNMPARCR